ncbi:MAG: AAA family ATPase [Minicystis sp.]
MDKHDGELFNAILERRATVTACAEALKLLSRLLAEHHREKVVILIDEYDSPIHAGYTHRYYDQVIAFFRDFLSAGLKDNSHLFKGVLTGILRVAKESLFSGLNNVAVYGILRSEFAPYFGFTEPEVKALVEAAGEEAYLDDIRSFYNGYLFGRDAIYNPWSVLNFLRNVDKELLLYWIDTSSNDLVRELLLGSPGGVRVELETLLAGGTIEVVVDENIVLRDLSSKPEAVWSFLLFTGYLKAVEVRLVETIRTAKLAVPNTEVRSALLRMVHDWLVAQVGSSDEVRRLLDAMLRGDGPVMEQYLSHVAAVNISYFDAGGRESERFYHGLVVGLLANLGSRYEVRSNRESGFGRCDVLVLPRTAGQPGVALELKRVDTDAGETAEKALTAALKQIRDRDYGAELRARGASPIHEIAAVFDGKRAYVRVAP